MSETRAGTQHDADDEPDTTATAADADRKGPAAATPAGASDDKAVAPPSANGATARGATHRERMAGGVATADAHGADIEPPHSETAQHRSSAPTGGAHAAGAEGAPPSEAFDGEPPADGDETATENADAAAEPKRGRSFWRELPVLVVVALVLAFLIKSFLVQAFYIPSESMENTLLIGDRVLVNKLAYRIGDVERGDVIVFDGTNSFDAGTAAKPDTGNIFTRTVRKVASSFGLAPGSDNDYIKRVIGIGGDRVVCCDANGNITVNGIPLRPEDYLFPGDSPSNIKFDITVPDGRVWVMGDHRSRSEDSRAHLGNPGGGTVPVDHIVGRAFVIVWPFNRFDTLTRPAAFDKIAAASG